MITIPEYIWAQMLAEFHLEERKVEQVCYFDGVVNEAGDGVVTTLVIPNALLKPGRFEVRPEAMSQAGKHLRTCRLRRLAQVHTHPTEWVGHSGWDDERAYSQLSGAVSIVLPNFGRGQLQLQDAGIHLRTPSNWQQLEPKEISRLIRVIPSFFDFRNTPAQLHEHQRVEPPRERSWWDFFAFFRR